MLNNAFVSIRLVTSPLTTRRRLDHMERFMRITLFASWFLLSLSGCQSLSSPEKLTSQGDGSSADLAVDLSAARTEFEGIQAEKVWLNQHYPGARVKSQSLIAGKKMMDLLTIVLPSGEEREVYFDISSFFGKL